MEPSGDFVEEDEERQLEGLESAHMTSNGEKGESPREDLESGHTAADVENGELHRQEPQTEDGQVATDGEKDLGHTGGTHATDGAGYDDFADDDRVSNIEQATQIHSQGMSYGQDSCESGNEKNDAEIDVHLGELQEKDDMDGTRATKAFEMNGTLGYTVRNDNFTNRMTSQGEGDSPDSGSPPFNDPTKGPSGERAALITSREDTSYSRLRRSKAPA